MNLPEAMLFFHVVILNHKADFSPLTCDNLISRDSCCFPLRGLSSVPADKTLALTDRLYVCSVCVGLISENELVFFVSPRGGLPRMDT